MGSGRRKRRELKFLRELSVIEAVRYEDSNNNHNIPPLISAKSKKNIPEHKGAAAAATTMDLPRLL